MNAELDDPLIARTLEQKLPGIDPSILSEWNRPIAFDYNHRSKPLVGVLYVDLDGRAAFDAASTVVIPSPWPWQPPQS
jgi:hypothetical protein